MESQSEPPDVHGISVLILRVSFENNFAKDSETTSITGRTKRHNFVLFGSVFQLCPLTRSVIHAWFSDKIFPH